MSFKTIEEKKEEERNIDSFEYEGPVLWDYIKRLRSETQTRTWHVKVFLGKMKDDKNLYEDFAIIQTRIPRMGEKIYIHKATSAGRPIISGLPLIEIRGTDWLKGLEELLNLAENSPEKLQ